MMGFLLKDFQLASGMVLETVYLKVDTVSGSKSNINAIAKIYLSREAANNGFAFVDQATCSFTPEVSDESPNYHKQTYEHMKTLDEYSHAVDVLEDKSINTSP